MSTLSLEQLKIHELAYFSQDSPDATINGVQDKSTASPRSIHALRYSWPSLLRGDYMLGALPLLLECISKPAATGSV